MMNLLRWLLLFWGIISTVSATSLLPDYLRPPRFQIIALSEDSFLVYSASDGTCRFIKSPLDRTTVAKFHPRSHVVRAGQDLVSVGSNTIVRLSAETRTTNVIFSSPAQLSHIWNDDQHLLVTAHSENARTLVKLRVDSGTVVWSAKSALGYTCASARYVVVQRIANAREFPLAYTPVARVTYCYDASNGKRLWSKILPYLIASERYIADGDGVIYARVGNKVLQLSGSTGYEKKRWTLAGTFVLGVSYCHGNLFAVVGTSKVDPLAKSESWESLQLLDGEKWRSVCDLSGNLPKTIESGEHPWLILRGPQETGFWDTAASRLELLIPGKLLDVQEKTAFSLVDAGKATTIWRTHLDSGVSKAILTFGPRGLER